MAMDGHPGRRRDADRGARPDRRRVVGSASRFVPVGEHTYVITYRIDGVIEPGTTGETSPVLLEPGPERVAPVHRPLRPDGAPAGGSRGHRLPGRGRRRRAAVPGPRRRHRHPPGRRPGRYAPNIPVTIKTGLDLATPAVREREAVGGPLRPGARRAPLPVAAGRAARARRRGPRGRLRRPGPASTNPSSPCMYAPPEGIGPAQAAYLLTETIDSADYVATLMYAAEKGAIDLEQSDAAWTITDKTGAGRLGRARPGHSPGSRTCSADPARRSRRAPRTSRAASGSRPRSLASRRTPSLGVRLRADGEQRARRVRHHGDRLGSRRCHHRHR